MKTLKISNTRDYQSIRALFAREDVQAYTMAVLSFFALAFFSIFAIRPTLISYFNLRRQITDSQFVEKQLDNKINALLKVREEYDRNQTTIAMLESALPNDPLFPELVRKIETVVNSETATMSAFSTEDFSLLNEQQDTLDPIRDLATINLQFTIAPEYTVNKSVLSHLLNLRRLLTFSTLEFSKTEDRATDETIIETTAEAHSYFQSLGNE